jgi:lipid II:glycine glycyltransferase (peptidoglycan interpeptide bridge formation enzyme)
MKEAKKRGSLVWDFEGIFDQRFPNKDILGYTHFKKSFGGKEIEFPGAFTKWFW